MTTGVGMLKITCSDGNVVDVKLDSAIAKHSKFIKDTLENYSVEDGADVPMALNDISSETLIKINQWCTNHSVDLDNNEIPNIGILDELHPDDKKLLEVDNDALYYLITATDYLIIEGFRKVTAKELASRIRGKTPAQLIQEFNLPPLKEA